jgi:single-stranded DNA-binding protein
VIAALISGTLLDKPVQRMSRNDRKFATAKLRASAGDGQVLFADLIAFAQSAVEALLALDRGDAVSVAGELAVSTWTAKTGEVRVTLKCTVATVMSAYGLRRKRQAASNPAQRDAPQVVTATGADDALDDSALLEQF